MIFINTGKDDKLFHDYRFEHKVGTCNSRCIRQFILGDTKCHKI